jgi:hypothetical protein
MFAAAAGANDVTSSTASIAEDRLFAASQHCYKLRFF